MQNSAEQLRQNLHENSLSKAHRLIQATARELQRIKDGANPEKTGIETQSTTFQRIRMLVQSQMEGFYNLRGVDNIKQQETALVPHIEELISLLNEIRTAFTRINNLGYWELVLDFVPEEVYKALINVNYEQNPGVLFLELKSILQKCFPEKENVLNATHPPVIGKFLELFKELDLKIDARFKLVEQDIVIGIAHELLATDEFDDDILEIIPTEQYLQAVLAQKMETPSQVLSLYEHSIQMGFLVIADLVRRHLVLIKNTMVNKRYFDQDRSVLDSDLHRFLLALHTRYSNEISDVLMGGNMSPSRSMRLITNALWLLSRKITAQCLVSVKNEILNDTVEKKPDIAWVEGLKIDH